MNISPELIAELKLKQEQMVAEILPLLAEKDYLKELIDPAMLPLIAASFMQSLHGALDTGHFDSFRNTVDWLFQMAEAKQLVNPLEKFLDFFTTVEVVVKKHLSATYHGELMVFADGVKQIFREVAQGRNA